MMEKRLISQWYLPWKWHLAWWHKGLDEDFNIYWNFAGFGPWQFHWWSS